MKNKENYILDGTSGCFFDEINFQNNYSCLNMMEKGCLLVSDIFHVVFGIMIKRSEVHSEMLFSIILIIGVYGSKIILESFICNPSRYVFFFCNK